MAEVMRRDFNEHHMMQVPITENQLGTMQMMGEVSDHVGMNYPVTPDSRFVAQPVDDFLFPWEEEGSVENPITIDEDARFCKCTYFLKYEKVAFCNKLSIKYAYLL